MVGYTVETLAGMFGGRVAAAGAGDVVPKGQAVRRGRARRAGGPLGTHGSVANGQVAVVILVVVLLLLRGERVSEGRGILTVVRAQGLTERSCRVSLRLRSSTTRSSSSSWTSRSIAWNVSSAWKAEYLMSATKTSELVHSKR